jgi:hypothetical protein
VAVTESVAGQEEEEEEEEEAAATSVEAGVVQATRTAPSETQEARSRTAEGRSRPEALTIGEGARAPDLRGAACNA